MPSPQLLAILVLAAMFLVASVWPINLGALGFAAAFLVGTYLGLPPDGILGGFPANLFLILVGVTYLFGIASANGTVDVLVGLALRLVRGRVAGIPWVMFFVSAALTAVGALSPAAVAIVAPIALGFAARYDIPRLLMGAMVVHGAQAGGFSPVSVYGGIVQGIVDRAGLSSDPMTVFVSSFIFNFFFACLVYLAFARSLFRRHTEPGIARERPSVPTEDASHAAARDRLSANAAPSMRLEQAVTIAALALLLVLTVGFGLDLGFTAVLTAVALALVDPRAQKEAVSRISWPIVLLLTGVLTYVHVLQEAGAVDYVSAAVVEIGSPVMSALVLCYLAGVVTAFASSTAMLGVLIPLMVPVLSQGDIGAVAMVSALAISVTMPDVSPFSTNGALVLANAPATDSERLYRALLIYTAMVIVAAPVLAWAIIILPGWL